MHRSEIEHLKSIRSFPSLIKYLRNELGWPIKSDNFDDLMFEYEPEELGIDAKTAVKIKDIKQLRPLVSKQPWGIFFINFEPKQLPIVVLRRILRSLVIKQRGDATKAHQAAWKLHDLLFISSYGESEHREITFAHFNEPSNRLFGDLPTLRVLGWDDDDTKLKLDHVVHTLSEKMRWPEDADDAETWRMKWSDAFELRPREVITTSKDLAIRLADLAKRIRQRANLILAIESEKGSLRKMHKAFQTALIHDLNEDGFADMYAQTIAYGLLAARVSRPAGIVADNLVDMVPITNPFLKEMLGTFLSIGGRKGKIDFDELGIQEVVDLLNNPDTHMEAILRDFGKRTMQEDPVIHFYELFLKEYDKKKKVERGVFYTPQSVVSYIIRSVHELLQNEFGLEDGLASTVTWGEMAKLNPHIKIPEGVLPDEHFVQMLDPATGTATFLVEIIEVVYQTMISKWRKEKYTEFELGDLWNEYVPKHLLPRLYGFELMMAPYAIAHMKIGLKLAETGYKFRSDERAHIYLTNSLEPPSDMAEQPEFEEWSPALAHEAKAVNAVKRKKRFTIVVGNPPYSGISSNMTEASVRLIDAYKVVDGEPLNERKHWLQDDYVKFIRTAQSTIEKAHVGILGYITNHGYLDNPTFRGMRQSIKSTFQHVRVLDLHGNTNKKEKSPDGTVDKNVFDIRQGVAICLATRASAKPYVQHADLWGTRDGKYKWLAAHSLTSTSFTSLTPDSPYYFFEPQNTDCRAEYDNGWKINEAMPVNSAGFITARDHFVVDFDEDNLLSRIAEFKNPKLSDAEIRARYFAGCGSNKYPDGDTRGWKVPNARKHVQVDKKWHERVRTCSYRPFDQRHIYWVDWMVDWPRPKVMSHMVAGSNIAFHLCRQSVSDHWSHVLATRGLADDCYVSNKTRERGYTHPLYCYARLDGLAIGADREANLSARFLKEFSGVLRVEQTEPHGLPKGLTPEDIFHYTYAIFYSPGYRTRYAEFLKIDFPRLPLTSSLELCRELAKFGGELVTLHLMDSPKLDKYMTRFVGKGSHEVEKISYADETVWIDKAQIQGFQGVPENVWNFHIGGYQVCEKWLKDRGPKRGKHGRTLSGDDINHYHRIVVALNETIRIMAEIDNVIEQHGGWPDAFLTDKDKKEEYTTQPEPELKVAEAKPTYKPIK